MLLNTPTDFSQHHVWDRWFFPITIVAIWIVILLGFVPAILHHLHSGESAYPLIIHIHAVAFVGWLALLSAQVTLIRNRRYDVHRRIGACGGVLALAMIILGPWASIVSERMHFGTPLGDPPFLSVEFIEMVVFPIQVGAAIWLRRDAAAHKRMMLLATLFLTTAGFGRWLAGPLYSILGDGFIPFLVEFFTGTILLVLMLGTYDVVTRRRLHPAYVAGAVLGIASEVLASWLYVSPAWKAVALKIVGN
jgi:uncharacterized membrane protein YozB (DUF420 family)